MDDAPSRSISKYYKSSRRIALNPLPPLATRAGLDSQGLDRQFDVLRTRREETSLVTGDRVSGHAESFSQFALSETEEEPLLTKLPTGQVWEGYLGEHFRSNVGPTWPSNRAKTGLRVT